MKWRAHPADVLPLWVAEMDVHLPPTVAEALRRAVDDGDTGYPCGTALAEAVSEFAARRWDWDDLEVGRTALVPDVMLGIVEVLRLVTDRGDAVVVNPPVYAPFYAFVAHDGRRVIEAPLAEGRIDLGALAEAFFPGPRDARERGLPVVQSAQPDRHGAHARGAAHGGRTRARIRRPRGVRRDPRARHPAGIAVHPLPDRPGRRTPSP